MQILDSYNELGYKLFFENDYYYIIDKEGYLYNIKYSNGICFKIGKFDNPNNVIYYEYRMNYRNHKAFITPSLILPMSYFKDTYLDHRFSRTLHCNIQMVECHNFKIKWSFENHKYINKHFRENIKWTIMCNKFMNSKMLKIPKFVLYEILYYIVN